ncbi:asparagine synthase-related protein [Candidatus Lokiarchaeum ossiferum]|uniref:asparagine synthase-related protein n=1 Tax=Candidatus Lokiarchaeum ossiferum TaxID=2951803 RepID=UPI00352F50FC
MTGIVYYHKKNKKKPINIEHIHEIAEKIAHRGNFKKLSYHDPNSVGIFFLNKGQMNTEVSINNKGFSIIDGYLSNERIKELNSSITNFDLKYLESGYKKHGIAFFKQLIGEFSILIKNSKEIVAVRDQMGFNPLYYMNQPEFLLISSELKIFSHFSGIPRTIEPGQAMIFSETGLELKKYYNFNENTTSINDLDIMKQKLSTTLDRAVQNSIGTNGKVAALLSGGIDSVVICALAQKYIPNLDVYTVVAENSPDLEHAKNFTKMYPEVNHHIFKITIEEMLPIIDDVIYHLETFDAALIRSAIPMYYICSKIGKKADVLLTGEGGDELFGGYDYLKELTSEQFDKEIEEMLKIEHSTGLQRVDRIPYAFGIEARAPWFNKEIVDLSFTFPSEVKLYKTAEGELLEKWIIRESFKKIIPLSVYKRHKAKFSKGVGSQFILRDYFDKKFTDDAFNNQKEIFPGVILKNKEELHYWQVFNQKFGFTEEFIQNMPRTSVFIV